MESLKGHLLLASPKLPDDNFFRSVVIIISHDEEGALGVVLNRGTAADFSKIWSEFTGEQYDERVVINWGGPVSGPPIAIHDDQQRCDAEILPEVFMATSENHIGALLKAPPEKMRIFCGYAGWAPAQLESEIRAGGWLVARANPDHIFEDDEEQWKSMIGAIGNCVMFGEGTSEITAGDPGLN